jgi:EAL domain-containing protein (putative c-di-GMP-specific phosphodiesterase class I)
MLDHLDLLHEARVTAVDDAIADGRIAFAVQRITAVDRPEQTLYGECHACLIDPDGTFHRAAEFIPTLEALGATPSLDRHLLKLVQDELEADPLAILGCNLSVDNMSGENWASVYDQMSSRSQLASRLVIEITESKPWASPAMACDFLAEAKKLGCRVAIDDFGIGYSTFGRLIDIEADIVKIDPWFVYDLLSRNDGHDRLCHLVGLAGCVAPIVVVESIETTTQLHMAKASGASHVQGYLLSKPILLHSRQSEHETRSQNWIHNEVGLRPIV